MIPSAIVDIICGSNGLAVFVVFGIAWALSFGSVLAIDKIQNKRKRGKRRRTNTDRSRAKDGSTITKSSTTTRKDTTRP